MFERAPGLNFHDFGLCRCAAAQFQMAWYVARRAVIRLPVCLKSNTIGRQREIWPSDEAETIRIFWKVFRA